jgi:PEP-CTERM putative exosortase interaction domain
MLELRRNWLPHRTAARRRRASAHGAALAVAAAATLVLSLSAPVCAQTGFGTQLVLSGLNNPRGITFGPDGALYVAEAGIGADPSDPNPPGIQEIAPPNPTVFYGTTGSVTRYDLGTGTSARVVTGIGSLAVTGGGGAIGLADIAFDSGGNAYGVTGWVNDPALRATFNDGGGSNIGNRFGQLVSLDLTGNSVTNVADIGAYEDINNPDPPERNSNPFSLTVRSNGDIAVVDAGANALYNVSGSTVSLITTFPYAPNPGEGPPFYQPVPTAVAEGAGGLLFVSELTGFPFPAGGSDIYVVDPTLANIGDRITRTLTGFTTVIDLAFNSTDGFLYVLQYGTDGLDGAGQLLRVDPTTGDRTLVLDSGLTTPGGLAIGADGSVYVTNLGVSPGGGQILRVVAVPEPATGALLLLGLGVAGAGALRRRRRIAK